MARKEDRGSEATGVSESPKAESTQMKIRWDSANMRSAYANVFNVAGTREEVVILFGMNQSLPACRWGRAVPNMKKNFLKDSMTIWIHHKLWQFCGSWSKAAKNHPKNIKVFWKWIKFWG